MYQIVFLLIGLDLLGLADCNAYCKYEQIKGPGGSQCKEIYQMNCPKKCFNPTECPEGKCFDVYAKKFHDHHVHDAKTGCPTCCCCEWVDCPCGYNRCHLDEEGCPTNKCLEPERHRCPQTRFCPRDCDSGGQGGYVHDSWGCKTCECNSSFESQLFDRVYTGFGKHKISHGK